MKEVWKPIKGLEGVYKISNKGNVLSFQKAKPYKMKNNLNAKYYRVLLSSNGYFLIKIHRLVAEAFIPNPLNKPCVNHINGIKTDNRVENLEWCTASENQLHAYRTGLCKAPFGQNHSNAKLNEKQVRLILHLKNCRPKMARKDIGKLFNITVQTVGELWRGESWKHITI